jgi:chromosome segregation protein
MFLRSLTLKGFKSFAEATTLEFEPGLTVVVGPNGSGKSNVVDAVAWVLGAQGPRTVRSTKMDDVIFAGTGRRPALGRAEVSLTIDNTRGVLPIDFTEVTITRTLFRSSGESEYTLNGVPCRLLDLQELLSDTGVGRQQHIIVSQGNLDAILDSRPEDRRLIVEEAAGILKFRRRKEKAERRLEGTEANLLRLTDLLREVGRQLRPLERQADAARRHGDLVGELHALQVFLRGREVAVLTARHQAAMQARAGLVGEEARVKAELEVLDTSVVAAEIRVSELGRVRVGQLSLSDGVGRLEALRERTRGLVAVVTERRRSVERDLAVSVDSALIAALDDDAGRLRAELADVEAAAEAMAARFQELAQGEADLARERAGAGEPSTRANAAAEARGELGALRSNLDRGRADLARLEHRLSGLDARAATLGGEADRVSLELARLAGAESELVAVREQADADRRVAAAALAAAESAAREAAAGHHTWAARAEALAMAVDESRGTGDTDRLAGVDGVVGTLLDLVDIDAGFEAAFEAAVVEAVGAVVVDGVATGRRLLDDLAGAGAWPTGVLPLGSLLDPPAAVSFHGPARPLRSVVRSSHPGVERLLRHLLADVVVVDGGWEEAVDVTLAFPDVVAVTRAGDRISAVGWRLGVGAPGVTRAALDEARARAGDLAQAVATADTRLTRSTAAAQAAAATAARAAAEASAAATRYRQLDAAATTARADARRVAAEIDDVRAQRDRTVDRIAQEAARVAELESLLPALDQDEAAGAARVAAERADRARIQSRAEGLVALRAELEVRAAGLDDSRTALARRLAEVEARLAGAAARRQESESRRARLLATRAGLDRLGPHLDVRRAELDVALADLRQRRDAQVRALADGVANLDGLRRRRQAVERSLGELRERSGRVELESAEARLRLETVEESLRRELDTEPADAMVASCPPLPPGTSAAARVRDLERELRLMGPVNPLALQELEALQERHVFLTEQLDDIKGSRRELVKIIRAVETEMAELLTAALADVTEHFAALFETLFPGGQGRLHITSPDDVLLAGLELDCRPAGKNVRKLSLLSGGERALCALAFLFAVFRSRPSPFYLLDEVEAALDDVNLHRFIDLLQQFRDEAQLVVVTHQKRTMEAADSLYGVTLQPGGSSKVVSEKVRTPA